MENNSNSDTAYPAANVAGLCIPVLAPHTINVNRSTGPIFKKRGYGTEKLND